MTVSDTDIAWAAGFLDGEGHYGAKKNNARSITVRISVSQVVRDPLDKLASLFGGKVVRVEQAERRPIWHWRIESKAAVTACIEMTLPYLLVKRRQAEVLHALAQLIGDKSAPRSASVREPIYAEMRLLAQKLLDIRKEESLACST